MANLRGSRAGIGPTGTITTTIRRRAPAAVKMSHWRAWAKAVVAVNGRLLH
jgi:hypothetical protein